MLLLLLVACSIAPVDEARDLLPLAPPTALLADDIGGWPLAAKAAPLSLGTTDGAALELTNLVGRAVVEEPLAWTELHLTYANSEARQREGRFTIRLPEGADIGEKLNAAMGLVEAANSKLAGVLPRSYNLFTPQLLAELLKRVSEIPTSLEFDAFGRIYEYFLGQFARSEGQKGGEFFTPPPMVV
jgi:hypothetical protein